MPLKSRLDERYVTLESFDTGTISSLFHSYITKVAKHPPHFKVSHAFLAGDLTKPNKGSSRPPEFLDPNRSRDAGSNTSRSSLD
ncbi:hypothetical protein AVEN_15618-1 [Araneus ventricosus]|uniref:Uncharacterized protein n=1 Tax=Araneus ventricosus TaxID=182803 RepID=A0A4Y2G6X0_ARAVE|nr:hypothetical protein AVEN_15618-1 [Araneus ventricosus]